MRALEWFVIIVSLVVIAIFLIFGKQFASDYNYGFGTWVTTRRGCSNEADACDQPAFEFANTYCVPDPKTRRGCLGPSGLQTYATQIERTPCQLQCRRFKWDVKIDPCDPLTHLQKVTYTCKIHDQTGINACTLGGLVDFNGGAYQDLTEYQPPDTVEWKLRCLTQNDPAPKLLDRQVPISYTEEDPYTLEEDCRVETATTLGSDTVSTPTLLQEGRRLSNGAPCRYWNYQDPILFTVTLADQGVVVPLHLPTERHQSGAVAYRDWGADRARRLTPVPLVVLPATKRQPGCDASTTAKVNGALFVAVPVGPHYRIGLLLRSSYWGWLGLGPGRWAHWEQAALSPATPGKRSAEVDLFQLLWGTDSQVEIRTARGLEIYVSKIKGLVKVPLAGIADTIPTQTDLRYRLNSACDVYWNPLQSGRT